MFSTTCAMEPPTESNSGVKPLVRNSTMPASDQLSLPGVIFGMRPLPAGFAAPPSHFDVRSPPRGLRGVWHSVQCAIASTI